MKGSEMKTNYPKPPAHLSEPTRAWWRTVVKEFELQPHHLRLLQSACEVWDRQQQARELLARDGLVIPGSAGMRPHPAVAIERDARIGFSRIVRELDLDTGQAAALQARPPALKSNRKGS
jgi:P27 family predicted phage terminase small subunit